jgi:hypothetical protein
VANRALLDAASLPREFHDERVDVGDRWGEIIDETRDATSLRPDCQEPLAAASDQLYELATQTAGAKFTNGAGSDITQFVAVLPSGVGPTLVDQVRAVYSHCDSFAVTEPEFGSIILTVELLHATVPPGAHVVVWSRTLMVSDISRVEYRAFYAYGTVAGAIAFEGQPTLGEVSTVMAGAIARARRAAAS